MRSKSREAQCQRTDQHRWMGFSHTLALQDPPLVTAACRFKVLRGPTHRERETQWRRRRSRIEEGDQKRPGEGCRSLTATDQALESRNSPLDQWVRQRVHPHREREASRPWEDTTNPPDETKRERDRNKTGWPEDKCRNGLRSAGRHAIG